MVVRLGRRTSVMVDVEVRRVLQVLGHLDGWNRELGLFLVVLSDDLVLVGHVSSLGEHAFLVQHRQDSHGLLHQLDGSLEIEPEVDESPVDSLPLVLFLFQDEHVVVEELLESLVGQVDAQLLECVELGERVLRSFCNV